MINKRALDIFDVVRKGRVIVLAFGSVTSSGVPVDWVATVHRPGVNVLSEFATGSIAAITRQVKEIKRQSDAVIVSLHWNGNWGYQIGPTQRAFAYRLIEEAQADIVYGHLSHPPKEIEFIRVSSFFMVAGMLLMIMMMLVVMRNAGMI